MTAGGKAARGGLVAGDYITTINGEEGKKLKHLQAQQIIKNTRTELTLFWLDGRIGIFTIKCVHLLFHWII